MNHTNGSRQHVIANLSIFPLNNIIEIFFPDINILSFRVSDKLFVEISCKIHHTTHHGKSTTLTTNQYASPFFYRPIFSLFTDYPI
jgi:hypothetical protein